jgi:hypothetical protein
MRRETPGLHVSDSVSKSNSLKRLAWLLGMLALIMSSLTVTLVHHYGSTRPTAIQIEQGRSHPVKIHERTVFLTTGEYAAALVSHAMAILAIGAFLGLLLKSRRVRN